MKQRKLTILGGFVSFLILICIMGFSEIINLFVPLPDISFTVFYYVHLVEEQKMIGTIMEIKGWTLRVHYLGACLEWSVWFGILFFFPLPQ